MNSSNLGIQGYVLIGVFLAFNGQTLQGMHGYPQQQKLSGHKFSMIISQARYSTVPTLYFHMMR